MTNEEILAKVSQPVFNRIAGLVVAADLLGYKLDPAVIINVAEGVKGFMPGVTMDEAVMMIYPYFKEGLFHRVKGDNRL